MFVCLYNDDKVDLFSSRYYSTINYSKGLTFKVCGYIYRGINSNRIAIYELSNSLGCSSNWKESGYSVDLAAVNCQINQMLRLDEVLGLMGVSEVSKVTEITEERMSSILKFASDYYKSGDKKTVRRVKVKLKKTNEQGD